MKFRYFIFLVVIFLSSCTSNDEMLNETPSQTIETPVDNTSPSISYLENVGYASGILITQYDMPSNQKLLQRDFDGSYSDVNYNPITQTLSLKASITDKYFRNATYYLVGRYVGSKSEERKSFTLYTSIASFSYTFYGVDLSREYEILLAKVDADNLNPTIVLDSVCTLTLYDEQHNQRYYPTQNDVIDHNSLFINNDEIPFIDVSLLYNDTQSSITSFEIVLYNDYDKKAIESKHIDIDVSNYDGSIISLNHLTFNNLSPNTDYLLQLRITGNDGIDDFNMVTFETFKITTPSYENSYMEDSFHGLFAVITGFEVNGDDVTFSYVSLNNGDYVYTDTSEPIQMNVYVSYSNDTNETFLLDMESNSFVLPYDMVKTGVSIYIFDARRDYTFSHMSIQTCKNAFGVYFHETSRLFYELYNYSSVLPNYVKLEIFDSNGVLIETFTDLPCVPGSIFLDLTASYASNEDYTIIITYEVNTLIGPLVHSASYPLNPNGYPLD